MGTRPKLLLLLAGLLLMPVFMLPLWSIRIVAPQYRDGLGMFIGLRDIWGHTEHDIQNINILNHYIGMKPIVPAEVDVLLIMPWVAGFLIAGALLVALANRRWLIGAWLVLFAVLGTAGMFEFYSWNYDYGSNLSPDAPIKVPGMTYVPPLIGTKTLLTIKASSYPSWGTLFIAMAFAAGLAALMQTRRASPAPAAARSASRRTGVLSGAAAMLMILAGSAAMAGCTNAAADASTPAFAPDGEICDFCGGEIPAERFGGELITASGDTLRFMSVECLAGFIAAGETSQNANDVVSIRVVDYSDGERLTDAATALYVRSEQRSSPNGLNLLASDSEKIAHNLHFFFGGERMSWTQVLELVRKEWTL